MAPNSIHVRTYSSEGTRVGGRHSISPTNGRHSKNSGLIYEVKYSICKFSLTMVQCMKVSQVLPIVTSFTKPLSARIKKDYRGNLCTMSMVPLLEPFTTFEVLGL